MNIFVNLSACSCERDRIFLESSPLLKELLQHLQGVVHSLSGEGGGKSDSDDKHECLWGCDAASVEGLAHAGFELDMTVHSETCMPLEMTPTVRQAFHNPAAPLLLLSPFRGVVSTRRIQNFLKSCGQDAVSASTFEINHNANPFWLIMIDPDSRREEDAYIDVHDSVLPKLNLKQCFCNITDGVAWKKFFPDNNIYGSQWLPPVKMMNQAMVYVPTMESTELRPVFCEEPKEEALPILYRLPIFDIAKNERLYL